MVKIKVPNASKSSGNSATETLPLSDSIFDMKMSHSFEFSSTRSSGDNIPPLEIDDDDILEVTLADGSRWYLSKEEREELKIRQNSTTRGAGSDVLNLGESFSYDDASRGISDFLLRKLRVFKLIGGSDGSVKSIVTDLLKNATPAQALLSAADPIAFSIARKLEQKLDTNGTTKLCRVVISDNNQVHLDTETSPSSEFSDAGPTLILLHGTLSSTQGSFGGLWLNNFRQFKRLHKFYQGRILALEHCTLTESPISNAKTVADALPDSATIHLLSHSRGGLIGELLCRSEREGAPFDDTEIDHFEELLSSLSDTDSIGAKAVEHMRKYHQLEHSGLKELRDILRKKSIRIERFVRVACPARGTTLASGRLHRWSNRSLNAIGLISGMTAHPMYQAFKAFTLGIMKSTSKPVVLPGLHSMMPDSALIHLLNDSFTREASDPQGEESATRKLVRSDLSVLVGDTNITGFNWKRIPLWLSDQFYGGEHDLVVNSASMDGGAERSERMKLLKTAGKDVNHFSYFKNSDTAAQIVHQLISPDDNVFIPTAQAVDVTIARGRTIENTGKEPMLFVIPGISGSKLSVDGDLIWLNPFRIALGGMSRLSIEQDKVVATDISNLAYGKFMEEFNQDHDVFCSPYDWRLSLEQAAEKLAVQINEEINARKKRSGASAVLRIVAHSMGGLVVRYMFAAHPDIWNHLRSVDGSRFIMAGTPNNGSYSINSLLQGKDSLSRKIAKLDVRNDGDYIVKMLATYPGVATLLPGFGTHDWLLPDTWAQLKSDIVKTPSAIISENLLTIARNERRTLLSSPLDSNVVAYVAGHAPKTISDADFKGGDTQKELVFEYTSDGDGRVTWRDGIPGGLNTVWYQNSTHGALLSEPQFYGAWRDLLTKGDTTELRRVAPDPIIDRSLDKGRAPGAGFPEDQDDIALDYLPSGEDLERIILELDRPAPRGLTDITPLSVTVCHGDLSFSRYPTVVGHYEGDSIVHAERALDKFLDFKLSERHRFDQYPGELNTSEVVFRKGDGNVPEGALIIGLGVLGELSMPRILRSLTNGIVNYILTLNEWGQGNAFASDADEEVGLSFLLIGSGQGGLSVEESVQVMINSVRGANAEFERNNERNYRLVQQIEIVELYQDVAVEAAHAAKRFHSPENMVSVSSNLKESHGGLRRTQIQINPEWWQTWIVEKHESKEEYKFENLTKSARSEKIDEPVDATLVDQYLSMIMDKLDFDASAKTSPYKTLFELLIPNAIKDISPDTDKLKLKLDKETARIPWEMMVDRWSADQRPLAVNKKMIRQLGLKNFRSHPDLARANNALVVGDPPSGDPAYGLLAGAKAEAKKVAGMLTDNGLTVTRIIRESDSLDQGTDMATGILNSLLTGEFKILHLAGHGSYYRGSAQSQTETDDEGMIIGKNMRLTPKMVNKMRRIPQVVFINCCHLGNIEDRKKSELQIRHADIASNLATQFIQNGALAVVAAAWEVKDVPAMLFAEIFYQNLLNNETLSHSIQQARNEVFENHKKCNTFGAYQCWGDPMYRLDPAVRTQSNGNDEVTFVSPEECVDEANNIRMRARAAINGDNAKLEARCDALQEYVRCRYVDLSAPEPLDQDWTPSKTRILTLLGLAYGELGLFPAAIHLLRSALILDEDHVFTKEIEQLGNFECRLAARSYIANEHHKTPLNFHPLTDSEDELISVGIQRLDELLESKTSRKESTVSKDLLCIMGSAMKRKATMQTGNRAHITKTLEQMRHCYGRGWICDNTLSLKTGLDEFVLVSKERGIEAENYSFTNMTLAAIVLQWFDNSGKGKKAASPFTDDFINVFRRYANSAASNQERPKSFWETTQFAIVVILQLLDDSLRSRTGMHSDRSELIELFKVCCDEAITRPGSQKQWASIYDDLNFIEQMLQKGPGAPDLVKEDMQQVRQIADAVSQRRSSSFD